MGNRLLIEPGEIRAFALVRRGKQTRLLFDGYDSTVREGYRPDASEPRTRLILYRV